MAPNALVPLIRNSLLQSIIPGYLHGTPKVLSGCQLKRAEERQSCCEKKGFAANSKPPNLSKRWVIV